MGVYLDRPSLDIDPRALSGCRNIRIKDSRIRSDGMGWENFPQFASNTNRINLDNRRVLMIDTYRSRSGSTTTLFANMKDIFRFNAAAGPPATVTYMTPRYDTGTASCAGSTTTIVGGGTSWDTDIVTAPVTGGYGKNAKAGYYIAFGSAAEVALDATWYEIDSVTDNTHLELLVDPGVVADGAYTIRQCLTGDNNDIFESEIFQDAQDSSPVGSDEYFLTNGVEMLSWNGAATEFSWFYPGFIAKNLLAHRQVLAFWNFIEGSEDHPGSLSYSELNNPKNQATNGAGRIQPADGVLDLLNVVPLGDQIVCYFQGDIVLMQYVGPPVYFIYRVAVPGVGLLAQRAIMDFGDYHEFLSNDSGYKFDGVAIAESGQQVFREVLRTISPNLAGQAYAHMDEENGEVIWSVPLTIDGSGADQAPTTAYTEHYLEDVGQNLQKPMAIRDFPFTAVGNYQATSSLSFDDLTGTAFEDSALTWDDRALSAAFPFLIAGDDNGDIYILNTSNTRNGAGFESYARFPRTALGDGEYKGLVHRIEPHTTRRQGAGRQGDVGYALGIELRVFDSADGDAVASQSNEFDLTHQGLRYVPFRRAGRYGDVRFFTNGIAARVGRPEPWDCNGYEIKVSAMGSR